jgi:hydrogenase nickel incorporation protein HypA/HybF
MHEHSLIANLLKQIEAIARENNAVKITGVKVKLGALSHMSPDHFREHFENETAGTLAEGAELEIEMMDDIYDPNAQDVLLDSIDVSE